MVNPSKGYIIAGVDITQLNAPPSIYMKNLLLHRKLAHQEKGKFSIYKQVFFSTIQQDISHTQNLHICTISGHLPNAPQDSNMHLSCEFEVVQSRY